MDKNSIILITFLVFMVEAIIHYNVGKKDTEQGEETQWFLPPNKSLKKLVLLVGVFSIVNAYLIGTIKK